MFLLILCELHQRVVTLAWNSWDTDPNCHRTMNPDMAPASSMDPNVPMASKSQCRPLRSTCLPLAWPSVIHVVSSSPDHRHLLGFCYNSGYRHQHRPQLQQDHGCRHGLGSSLGQDLTMASSYLPVSDRHGVSRFTFLHSIRTPWLHFLFHFSTTHSIFPISPSHTHPSY